MTKNESKVAVITGAASGIGRATVITMLDQGFQVAAMDVDTGGLDALSNSLQSDKEGGKKLLSVYSSDKSDKNLDLKEKEEIPFIKY